MERFDRCRIQYPVLDRGPSLGRRLRARAHCAQATTQGLKYVREQRDLPSLAPLRLRTAILTGKLAS